MIGRSPLFRLVALYCALLLLLGASFAFFTTQSFQRYTSATIYRSIDARSNAIWHIARDSLDDDRQLASLIEQRFAPEAQERFIRISDGRQVLYTSGIPPGTDTSTLQTRNSTPDPPNGNARYGSLLLTTRIFHTPSGRRITVESGQSDRFEREAESSLTKSLIFGLPVLLILAALGGYVLMRQSLKPIERMIDAAEAITFNAPGNRLPLAQTGDRVEALGLTLNRMLDRLDNAYQIANRFSVDAAHELRTPLAIVRGELDFIASKIEAPELSGALKNSAEEIERMSAIIENLGMLTRLQSLWSKRTHEEFDLNALAEETLDQMRLIAMECQIALSPLGGAPTAVAGDRSRIKQVLVNLLDNAFKYTPAGGEVSVDVRPQGTQAVLTVSDTGIGIAPEHHERIFDRFYRVSTERGETGSGLGLSIVKSICDAHGGAVEVESVYGKGSRFRVVLPLNASA